MKSVQKKKNREWDADMSLDFKNPNIRKHMLEGKFGLEKESLRVTPKGFLAHTKHPFGEDPHMERDFCENQTELITGVAGSAEDAWKQLEELQKKAVKTLLNLKTGKEYLWPFSNPPYVLGEKDIPIADYQGALQGKTLYREYLAVKYGKRKMLFSGIHFNFSFSEALLEEGYRNSGLESRQEYKDRIYLELAKKVTKYGWLIVYLTAASPVLDGSFFHKEELGKTVLKNLASPRCSKMGYWNDFNPILEYESLERYVESIESYIKTGQLKEAAELYYPVRLKPQGMNTLEWLKSFGVDHIELRMLDLNPLDPVGIQKEDVQFLHLFLLYLMSLKEDELLPVEQTMAIRNTKRAARYDEETIRIELGWNSALPVKNAALYLLASMERFVRSLGSQELVEIVRFQEEKLFCPVKRYAVQVRELFEEDYVKDGIRLAEKYAGMLGK